MTLDQTAKNQKLVIHSLPNGKVKAQIIRFGITKGAVVECIEVIPGGPVVVEHKRQEIAIGRKLAKLIGVKPLNSSTAIKRTGGVA